MPWLLYVVTGTLRANPGRTDEEPRGCSAGTLPPPPCSRTFPPPALETCLRRSYLAICSAKTFLQRAESFFCVDLVPAVGSWSQAQPVTYSRSQKNLQTPRAGHAKPAIPPSGKQMENTERRTTCTLDLPTSQRLVTHNFSPTIASYRGPPCTRDKRNITSELAPKDRLD